MIAEIGINHNGEMDVVHQLIDVAHEAGCWGVKFQTRNIDEVFTPEELAGDRKGTPWGDLTYRKYKEQLELEPFDYDAIQDHCHEHGLVWFSSPWDLKSQALLEAQGVDYQKVASAMITCTSLLHAMAKYGRPTYISTGMCTDNEVATAVDIFRDEGCPIELMHCVSTYPMEDEHANLDRIKYLRDKFQCPVGWSDHSRGLAISLAAVALGATSVERHITLDRTMYGSDQAASIEPQGLKRLVRDIRAIELARSGDPKVGLIEEERPIRAKLGRPAWYQAD